MGFQTIITVESYVTDCVDAMLAESPSIGLGKQYYQWTHREVSWYAAETRFLFIAENESDVEKWVVLLQWLIQSK